jgi:hypothetical protein
MTDAQRIWVDFLKTDDAGRLLLTARGTIADLEREGLQLREGLKLSVYSDDADDAGKPDDLVATGIVRRDERVGRWVLELDRTTLGHRSELKPST